VAWIVGIDEAGYGPNLGPFVMTSVACRVPGRKPEINLWRSLLGAVRSGKEDRDDRFLIDDSKVVYAAGQGLAELERGVLGTLWPGRGEETLENFLTWAGTEGMEELRREPWYRGQDAVPGHLVFENGVRNASERFERVCGRAQVGPWRVRCVVLCPRRFNHLVEANSKGAVLAHCLGQLLANNRVFLDGDDPVFFFIDKHGGRNTYAAQLQDALPGGMVLSLCEGANCSRYRVVGLERPIQVQFEPRADSAHFCVALASMVSKYLRERFMEGFNAFWQRHLPGLAATAGYPGDALRFWQSISPVAQRLGILADDLWRKK
jgi:hypothetical protein